MVQAIAKDKPLVERGDIAFVGKSGVTHLFHNIDRVMGVATKEFEGIADVNEIIATRAIQIDTGYEIKVLADGFTPQAQSLAEEYGIMLISTLRH